MRGKKEEDGENEGQRETSPFLFQFALSLLPHLSCY
jgi:hypothetical protein